MSRCIFFYLHSFLYLLLSSSTFFYLLFVLLLHQALHGAGVLGKLQVACGASGECGIETDGISQSAGHRGSVASACSQDGLQVAGDGIGILDAGQGCLGAGVVLGENLSLAACA